MIPNTKRGAWAALLLGLLVLALVLTTWRAADVPAPPREPGSAPPQDFAPKASSARPSAQRATAPLPASNAPLATIAEPLADRADRGDAKAACRLAMELLRCNSIEYWESSGFNNLERDEVNREKRGDFAGADTAAAAALERIDQLQQCRALPEGLRRQAAHYLRQAAHAGEPEAMLRYADTHHFRPDGRGMFAGAVFDDWRREAPGMLQRAFDAGVPEAPFYLMVGYQTDATLTDSLLPDDPFKAEALRLLLVRLHGITDRPGHSRLDPAAQARAAALANAGHEGPFKGRSYPRNQRLALRHVTERQRDGSAQDFCRGDALVP